uniref:Uncharacterized protein n=1 Tax=Meloidogyne hapla TaxID=6305 RepID=A0A1I8BFT9_MELHA
MAYDDNLPYQQDNQNIENNFKENLPTKGKKKYKRSKKAPTIKKVQENLKINENEGGQKMNFVIYLTILMNKRSQSLQVNRLWVCFFKIINGRVFVFMFFGSTLYLKFN